MHRSAGLPSGSASARVRPASTSTRWNERRAVARRDARPERGVRVHPLAGCRAGQQLHQDAEVAPLLDDLLDAHHGHERLRQRRAHAPVPLRLDDADRAGLRDREVRARDRRRARGGTPRAGAARAAASSDSGSSARPGSSSASRSSSRDLAAAAVERRDEQVRGPLARQLDDPLGEVRLDRLDPRRRASASLSPSSSVVRDFTFTTSRAPVRRRGRRRARSPRRRRAPSARHRPRR